MRAQGIGKFMIKPRMLYDGRRGLMLLQNIMPLAAVRQSASERKIR